jgi:hypothetical protein
MISVASSYVPSLRRLILQKREVDVDNSDVITRKDHQEYIEPEFMPLWYAAIKVLEENAHYTHSSEERAQDPRKESAAQRSLEEEAA